MVLDYILPNYPKLKLINLEDVNHYDMFLHPYGAAQIANAIYGEQ
jgi:hypothetical protein